MEKQIFKVGDRVFDIRYGWGVVDEVDRIDTLLSVKVIFDNYKNQFVSYNHKGCRNRLEENPLLSFKEYTLKGFSQKKPVNYNEHIGKWGKFWDNSCESLFIDKLKKVDYESKLFFPYNGTFFDNFEPLSEEQIKILNLK